MEIKTPTKNERIALHIRGVKMILVTSLLGVLAGFLSSPYILSQPIYINGVLTNPLAQNHSNYALIILVIAIYAQKFIFPPLGIDSKRFGFKDWFFLAFMTFCYWFIKIGRAHV